jgi:cell division protein FtsN
MIALLNYLPTILLVLTGILTLMYVHKEKYGTAVIAALCGIVLTLITAIYFTSYGPKGTVPKSTVPPFEAVEAPMENRLLQPAKTSEQRREDYYELTDWKATVEQAKQDQKQEAKQD